MKVAIPFNGSIGAVANVISEANAGNSVTLLLFRSNHMTRLYKDGRDKRLLALLVDTYNVTIQRSNNYASFPNTGKDNWLELLNEFMVLDLSVFDYVSMPFTAGIVTEQLVDDFQQLYAKLSKTCHLVYPYVHTTDAELINYLAGECTEALDLVSWCWYPANHYVTIDPEVAGVFPEIEIPDPKSQACGKCHGCLKLKLEITEHKGHPFNAAARQVLQQFTLPEWHHNFYNTLLGDATTRPLVIHILEQVYRLKLHPSDYSSFALFGIDSHRPSVTLSLREALLPHYYHTPQQALIKLAIYAAKQPGVTDPFPVALKRCYDWLCDNINNLFPVPQWIKDGKMSTVPRD